VNCTRPCGSAGHSPTPNLFYFSTKDEYDTYWNEHLIEDNSQDEVL
jgi:hypothetical protein